LKPQSTLTITKPSGNKLMLIIFILTMFFSVISQTLDNQISSVSRIGMYLFWLLTGLFLVYQLKLGFKVPKFGIVYLIRYTILLIVMFSSIILNNEHANTGILLPLTISLGAYFIGAFLFQINFTPKQLSKCLIAYVIFVCLLAIQIRVEYFTSLSDWMNQMQNLYGKKNSAGQIFAVSIILLLFFFNYSSSRLITLLRFTAAGFLFYVMLLIQCRSAMISLAIVCLGRIFFLKKGKFKYLFLFLSIGALALIYPDTRDIIFKALYINKYAGTDLNTFSSGRLGYWEEGLKVFYEHILVGVGNYYVDNFYINTLIQTGLLGFIIIVPIFLNRAWRNVKLKGESNDKITISLFHIIKLLTVFYFIESFFEGYPPFGPGVCAFIFWLLSGYLDLLVNKKENTFEED